MKQILLAIFFFITFFGVAQKKLTDYTIHRTNNQGVSQGIDSIHYDYSSWLGSLNQHKPQFGLNTDEVIPRWYWKATVPDYTSSEFWANQSYPLQQYETITKNYNGTNQCTHEEHSNAGYRFAFTYTSNGDIASITYETFNLGNWTPVSSQTFIYDGLNRLIVINNQFENGGNPYIHRTDSIEYNGSSSDVSRAIIYKSQNNGLTFHPTEEAIIQFNTGIQSSFNYFEDADSDTLTPMLWTITGNYIWNGTKLNSIDTYAVSGGTPDVNLFEQLSYTYDLLGRLTSETYSSTQGEIKNFGYDTDGFITSVETRNQDAANQWFTSQVETYYYVSTAELIEESHLQLTIVPNPTSDYFSISNKHVDFIEVFNTHGQRMIQQANNSMVDISHLPSGIYSVRAKVDSKDYIFEVIKQ